MSDIKSVSDAESSSREDRADAAIAEFIEAADSGQPLDAAEWLARHPDLAAELSEFLQDQRMWQRLAPRVSPVMAATPEGVLPWRRLGEYELVREIGRGGMGLVYEGIQSTLQRRVAVKVLPIGLVRDAATVARFQREGEAAARLRHPHIVPVLATGCEQGTHYLVMELVEGASLDRMLAAAQGQRLERTANIQSAAAGVEHAKRDHADPERCRSWLADYPALAGRLANVAEALQHAHEQGVVHRDVKPSNLLVAADGRLLLSDFGLAQVLAEPSLTRTGEYVGTPSYMSPEQISGNPPLDHRTDIFSLGATMYEVLAGQPPFVGASREAVLLGIVQREPLPPRGVNPAIPSDLETICLKCLEKASARRYATARDLAADLRRFADGHAIVTRRDGAMVRIAHRLRRSPTVSLVTAAAIVMMIVAAAFAWQAAASRSELLATRRQDAIDDALLATMAGDRDQTDRAIARAEQLGASAGWVAMLRGQSAHHRGEFTTAAEHLERAVALLPDSVAGRSMLATSYLGAGLWEKYEQSLDEIARLRPVTPHDMLFLGLAESYLDPAGALPKLDEAVRLRDSPIARLIRAEVRTSQTLDTGDSREADAALTDAHIAREMLPGHPSALLTSLDTNLVAAWTLSDLGDTNRGQVLLERAARDADALAAFSSLPSAVYQRALYFQQVGRDDEALAVLSQASERGEQVIIPYNYALALCRRGQTSRAFEVLSAVKQPSADESFLTMWLLWDSGRKDEGLALYRSLGERYPTGLTALFRPSLLLLTEQRDAAIADWKTFRSTNPLPLPRLRRAFYVKLLDFNCGDLSEEDVLRAAGRSHWDQCEAHYFIALHRLSQGNRTAAREHFQAAIASRCAGFMAWDWSCICLKRLEP